MGPWYDTRQVGTIKLDLVICQNQFYRDLQHRVNGTDHNLVIYRYLIGSVLSRGRNISQEAYFTNMRSWEWINTFFQLFIMGMINYPCREFHAMGESSFKPMVPAHFSFPLKSMNGHRNMWGRQCVSSWWPVVWLGYLYELCIDI